MTVHRWQQERRHRPRPQTERGLRYLVTAPGELSLARAYVQGDTSTSSASTRVIP